MTRDPDFPLKLGKSWTGKCEQWAASDWDCYGGKMTAEGTAP